MRELFDTMIAKITETTALVTEGTLTPEEGFEAVAEHVNEAALALESLANNAVAEVAEAVPVS